jgi:hypothetical protein
VPVPARRLLVAATVAAAVVLFVLSPTDHDAWSILRRGAIALTFTHVMLAAASGVRADGLLGLAGCLSRRRIMELEDRLTELEALLDMPEHLNLADLPSGVEDLFGELPQKRA